MKPIQKDELNIVASVDTASKLLGITKSKLRYYDQSGIIHSKRKEEKENSYRIYTREDILQLVDFMLHRDLDIAAKSIQELNNLPIEKQCEMVFNIIGENQHRIEEILNANKELLKKLTLMQKYLQLKERGYSITKTPEVSFIKEFHVLKPEHMHQWLNGPYSQTYAFICNSESPEEIFEGLADSADLNSPLIWEYREGKCSYLECITTTKYAYPNINDFEKHFEYMADNNMQSSLIICKFLLTTEDQNSKEKTDIYQTWIEIHLAS